MINIFTIGVYNSKENEFFGKLVDNNIDLFCDIRQRRGVRGSEYKFANSKYLQNKLENLGISYKYIKELAPTKEIRQKQKDADKEKGETKRKRLQLGDVFINEYYKNILSKFDLNSLVEELSKSGHKNIVFFCVEQFAEACHRSIVAKEISNIIKCNINNL